MLADVVAQHAEHEDHQRALDRHAVDELPAGLEHAADFRHRLGLIRGLEMLDDVLSRAAS